MILSSKPKPVRIRITVGGKEHTTLKSLQDNITPEIINYIDGRLQSWVERQGYMQLKEAIDEIKINKKDQLLQLYNLLLDKKEKKIDDFIYQWGDNDTRSKELASYIILDLGENTITRWIDHHFNLLTLQEWEDCIDYYPKVELKLVKKLKNLGFDIKAKRLLEKIREKNCNNEEVNTYYKLNFSSRLFASNTPEQLHQIEEDLSKYGPLLCNNKNETLREIEIAIKNFIGSCSVIFTSSNKKETAKEHFSFTRDKLDKKILAEFIHEVRCIRAIAFCWHDIRYTSNVREYQAELKTVPKDYIFYNEVNECIKVRDPNRCKELVSKIIHYILFKKIYQTNE